jgi:aromatic ring-cleaving dioxygenase
MLISIITLIILQNVLSHSTHYPHVFRNETCYKPEPAKIYSWHFHIIYWQSVEEHKKGALELRDKFVAAFQDQLTKPCIDLFHQDFMCMFPVDWEPVGPFVTAQWSLYFLPEHFNMVVPWIMQHRGKYDALVHPNTGCEVEDHSWWAIWGGKPWELSLDALSRDQPFPWNDKKSTLELVGSIDSSEVVKEYLKEHEMKEE